MPRSTMARRSARTFDKFLELRDGGAAAVAATTAETALAFDPRSHLSYKAVIDMAAFTPGTGGSWAVAIEVATTAGGTYTEVGRVTNSDGLARSYEIGMTGMQVDSLNTTAAFIRARAIMTAGTGGPSALTYTAFLAK